LERPISATAGGALRGVPTPTTAPEAPCSNSNKKNGPASLIAFALWQTPVADDAANRMAGKWNSRGEPKLSAQVKLWPTPTLHGNHNRKGASKTSGDGLVTAVKKWPTPSATMHKGSSEAALTRADGKSREMDRLDHAVMAADGGQLNPDWVDWLMGWPLGWGRVGGWKSRASGASQRKKISGGKG